MTKPTKLQLALLLAVAVLCFGAGGAYGRQLGRNEQAAAALLTPLAAPEPLAEATAEEDTVPTQPELIAVDVKGAVEQPGLYWLPKDSRIDHALTAAGLSETANTDLVNLSAPLIDGTEVIVPFRVEGEETDWEALALAAENSANQEAAPAGPKGSVNINTASLTALQTLSGIGPSKAQAIIDYRQKNGGFQRIEDIKKVSGIGDATYQKLKDSICVE